MYTSLLTPGGEIIHLGGRFENKEKAYSFLFSSSDPQTAEYRKEFADELTQSFRMKELFRFGATLPALLAGENNADPDPVREYDRMLCFLDFARGLEGFCDASSKVIPQSRGAKRCFLTFRNYQESFEYRKLKADARELIRAMDWTSGFSVSLNNPTQTGTACVVKETTLPDGICFAVRGAVERLGGHLETAPAENRNRTQSETAILLQILRNNEGLISAVQTWNKALKTPEITQILRILREAELYLFACFSEEDPSAGPSDPSHRQEKPPGPRTTLCRNEKLSQMAERERIIPPDATYEEAFAVLRENAVSLMEHLKFVQRNVGDSPLLRLIAEQVSVYPLLRPETAKVILHFSALPNGAMGNPQLRYLGNDDRRYWDKHASRDGVSVSLPKEFLQADAATQALRTLAHDFCQLTLRIREELT